MLRGYEEVAYFGRLASWHRMIARRRDDDEHEAVLHEDSKRHLVVIQM